MQDACVLTRGRCSPKRWQYGSKLGCSSDLCSPSMSAFMLIAIQCGLQDSKVAGEAETQPNVRLPSLREGRLPKLMSSALGCRLSGGILPASDIIILMDGGREGRLLASFRPIKYVLHPQIISLEGIQTSLLTSVKTPDGDSIPKTKTSLVLYHDEASLRQRRQRDKGHFISNSEKAFILTSDDGALPPYRDRAHYPGTTRGEVLGPISAASWEDFRSIH